MPEFTSRFNIAPGQTIHVLRDMEGSRIFSTMRWGFIPSWADDAGNAPMLHNARAESVAEKPMFRHAFKSRRCLIPASGYYEWRTDPGRKTRRPYYLSLPDGAPMSFAGLWELTTTASGEQVETCAVVTTKANALIEPIHHRMPVVLDRESWPLWLSRDAQTAALLVLLRAYPAERMQMWEVDSAVNLTDNDHCGLYAPRAGRAGVQAAML